MRDLNTPLPLFSFHILKIGIYSEIIVMTMTQITPNLKKNQPKQQKLVLQKTLE